MVGDADALGARPVLQLVEAHGARVAAREDAERHQGDLVVDPALGGALRDEGHRGDDEHEGGHLVRGRGGRSETGRVMAG